ncbi:caspase family protein, partial [Tychonema sp. BBK16]
MRRAFIMGSNGPSEIGSLQYALQDAENIKVALSGPLCQFKVSIPTVKSKAHEVLHQLAVVAESCTVEDIFICYFSGHGILDKGLLFLLWDESLRENLNTTALPVARIVDTLSQCKAHSKLLILDCCHAGAVVNKHGFKSGADKISEDNIQIQNSNYLVIMASDHLENARELELLKGSFLTINICSAISDKLSEADKDKDGKISIEDLRKWLDEKCIEHNKNNAKEYNVPQPYRHGTMKGDFYLTVDIPSVEPHRTTSLNDNEQYVVWRNEGRELRRLRDRVEDTQREWIQYQRDPKFLMMGGLLAQVKEKWSFLEQDLSCESQEFYEQSKSCEEEMSMSLQQQLDEKKIQYKIES